MSVIRCITIYMSNFIKLAVEFCMFYCQKYVVYFMASIILVYLLILLALNEYMWYLLIAYEFVRAQQCLIHTGCIKTGNNYCDIFLFAIHVFVELNAEFYEKYWIWCALWFLVVISEMLINLRVLKFIRRSWFYENQ